MTKNTPILVTGVPGNVGSVGGSVVKLLRERNLPVRALVLRLAKRSQTLSEETGAELVVADLTNGADVVRALRGCKRMYFGICARETQIAQDGFANLTCVVVWGCLVLEFRL